MQFIGTEPKIKHCEFIGSENNIIYCEPGVRLYGCKFQFKGENSLVYLSSGTVSITLVIGSNSLLYVGKHNYINTEDGNKLYITVGDENSVIIGSDCAISTDVSIEATDSHALYDLTTNKRVNYPAPVLIGDHVWIGRRVMILKGSVLSTGSVVGAGYVVAGKTIKTGEVWVGNPAEKVKDNVVYGHWDNDELFGTGTTWTQWNKSEDFKGDNAILIEDLVNNRDIEFWENLPTNSDRFIWR